MIKKLENINQILHDMNNILFSISGMILLGKKHEAQLKLEKIFGEISNVDKNLSPVDYLFNAKIKIAEKYKIDFQIDKNIIFPKIDDSELCIIFGNILDNAIESCVKLKLKNRFIKFQFDKLNGKYIYNISNSTKLSKFSKDNFHEHMGLEITKGLIIKNNGNLNLSVNKKIFTICITFP